ncbi:hypothetical protein D3C79_836660 [compost metagenome]
MAADSASHRKATDRHLQQPDQPAVAHTLGEHQRTTGQRTDPLQALYVMVL